MGKIRVSLILLIIAGEVWAQNFTFSITPNPGGHGGNHSGNAQSGPNAVFLLRNGVSVNNDVSAHFLWNQTGISNPPAHPFPHLSATLTYYPAAGNLINRVYLADLPVDGQAPVQGVRPVTINTAGHPLRVASHQFSIMFFVAPHTAKPGPTVQVYGTYTLNVRMSLTE